MTRTAESQTTDDAPSTAEGLRRAMQNFASSVAVVTTAAAGRRRGMTVGSLTSLSMEPPLISFNVERDSQTREVLADADRFAAHLLGEGEAEVSDVFARPDRAGPQQLARVEHRVDDHGVPVLAAGWAVLHCGIRGRVPAGDHELVIGRVEDVELRRRAAPLLYHRRTYRRPGARARRETA